MSPSIRDSGFESVPLFGHLSPRQLDAIRRISTLKHFGPGELLFYEGEESRFFHLLVQGEVSVFKSSGAAETIVVHRFRAPSFIAEVATLKHIPYPASAECTQDSTVMRIEREGFMALLAEDPALSIALVSSLTQKISALEAALQRHSAPNAAAKVARLILDDPHAFERLKGVEIAALLAITPETLSRMLKKFRDASLVNLKKPRGLTITDHEKLKALADNNAPFRGRVI